MQILFSEKIQSIVYRKSIRLVFALMGIWLYGGLFFGTSNFLTTTYTYIIIGMIFYCIALWFKFTKEIKLVFFSFGIGLFLGEFILRYIVRYPLSYSEKNGRPYILVDNYQRKSNLRFKFFEGRKDLYTLQFDSGEVRDNQCGDYQYADDICNGLGLRGELPDKKKKIILFLGDSFTEGAGAPVDSSVPELLRKYVVSNDSTSDVLNAGIAGNDIFFDWKMVQKLEHRYTLKQLVFIMNTTDINDVMIRGGNERFCSNGLLNYHSQPWWEPIYAVSYVFRLFVHNVLKRDYNLFSAAEQNKKHYLALNKMSTLISTEIVPWAVKRKVQLQFVVLPMRYELEAPNTYYHDLIHMLGGVNQINILNCLPRLKAEENLNAVYWTRDLHFTPQGYSIIANTLIDSCYR